MVAVCASSSVLEAQHQFVLPKRRAVEPSPPLLPALPNDADALEASTIEIQLHGQPGKVLRSARRILVTTKNREWLFQRNSVDARRVSATITEHPEKAVVEYAESDVRNLLGINGWADVLKLTSTDADKAGITIVSVRAGVDEGLLRPSHVRFPGYKLFDVADWLEGK
jgi:hypothetical protein